MICSPCSLKLWEGFLCAFLTWDGATTNEWPWINTEKAPWNRAQNLTEIGSTSKSLPKYSCFISAIYSIWNTGSTNLKVIFGWKKCMEFIRNLVEIVFSLQLNHPWSSNLESLFQWWQTGLLGTVWVVSTYFKTHLLKRKLEALQPFFTPSFPRYVESLSTLVSPSEVPSMQPWNSRTNARLFHCGDLLRLYEYKVGKLHHMGGTFNFKGCPILFETPVTENGHPKSLKSAPKIMWRSRLNVERRAIASKRNLYYPPVYRIYTWIWQTHVSVFKNSATFCWGVEEGKVSQVPFI